MRRLALLLSTAVLAVIVVGAVLWLDFQRWWQSPLPIIANDSVFDIEPGQGLEAWGR